MTTQQRIRATIAREPADRIPMLEIGFWEETIERFRKEGMPREYHFQPSLWGGGDYRAEGTVEDFLGLDRILAMGYDGTMRLSAEVYEETDDYVIVRNPDGIKWKSFKDVTAPIKVEGVKLSALKHAENSEGIILRVYEPLGKQGTATVTFDRAVASAEMTDINEKRLVAPVEVCSSFIRFDAEPFCVYTIHVKLCKKES